MYQVFLYEQLQVDALHLTEEQLQKLSGGGELIYISGEDRTFHLGQIAARPGEYFILSINMESSIFAAYLHAGISDVGTLPDDWQCADVLCYFICYQAGGDAHYCCQAGRGR